MGADRKRGLAINCRMSEIKSYVPTTGIVGVMDAINSKDYTKIREEIANGKDPNVGNQVGALPLELAAWKGDQQLMDILLDAGADPAKCKKLDNGSTWAIDPIKHS